MKEEKVTVACVSFETVWGNKKKNLEKIIYSCKQAATWGANIVLFPELSLTGYTCSEEIHSQQGPCEMHSQNAETIPGASTDRISQLAKELGIFVIIGMVEKSREQGGIYISAPLIGPEGIVGVYKKMNLGTHPFWTENRCFRPGSEIPVFDTKFGCIGIQICFDFWRYPEITRIQSLKGANLIVNLAASGDKADKIINTTLVRAMENYVFAATAVLTGKEKGKVFSGNSVIAGPSNHAMHLYARGDHREGLVMATVNYTLLKWWNEKNNWRKKETFKIIRDELNHLFH